MATTQLAASARSSHLSVPKISTECVPTIRVVEDDPRLREVMAEVLEAFGYRVFKAAEAVEAFFMFQQHADDIDLVFSDVVLKGGNGRALIQEMKVLRPGLQAILSSGYPEYLGEEDDGLYCLPKPFSASTLLEKVQQVLRLMRSK
jgi:two-component system cell cycle sensor histidine kinase/response regulator CckA